MSRQPLRLLAQDADDLQIISAALQDAVCKVGDIHFDVAGRTLTVSFNRFCWEGSSPSRTRAALQLGFVRGVQARRVRQGQPDAVMELLAIGFEPLEAPGGWVVLSFAGGGDLRCEVECVDAVLADLSAPWPTRHTPRHTD